MRTIAEHPLVAGAVAAGVLVAALAVPLLGPLLLFVPLPLFLLTINRGAAAGGVALAMVLLATAAVGDGQWTLILLVMVMFGVFPLLAGHLLGKGWGVVYCSSLALGIGMLFLVLLFGWFSSLGVDPQTLVAERLLVMQEELIATFIASGSSDAKTVADLRFALEQIVKVVAVAAPAIMVSSWCMLSVGNLLLARQLLLKWRFQGLPEEYLKGFRLPFWLIWPLIGAGVASIHAPGVARTFAINVVVLLVVPYFFQGTAVVHSWFHSFKIGTPGQAMFYISMILWEEVTVAVVVVGLFDTWFNFRARLGGAKQDDSHPGGES